MGHRHLWGRWRKSAEKGWEHRVCRGAGECPSLIEARKVARASKGRGRGKNPC